MGKKRSRSQKQVVERATGNRGRILAIGLLISLLVGGAVFAQRGFFALRKPQTTGNAASPMASPSPLPTDPASPSKEYIYAGGRLIATEEPPAAPPPTCNYSLSAQSLPTFTSGGGSSTLTVNASPGCSWTVTASSWITINSATTVTGGGSISFTVQPNTDTTSRSGSITVTGTGTSPATTLTCGISQSGSSCIFTLNPTAQGLTYPAKNNNTVTVLTSLGCVWTAVSNAAWITVDSPTGNVTGGGTVTYSVTANTSGISRQGTIKIAGKDFTVTQSPQPPPSSCTYALSPTSKNFPSTGGSGTVSLTIQGGCGWSASTSYSWIHITPPTSGSGSANISYTIDPNTTTQQRVGIVSFGSGIPTFPVTQDPGSGGTGTGTGLRAEYYTFCGACPNPLDSAKSFEPMCNSLVLTRTDPVVDFDWGTGSFSPSFSQDFDYFMARWTGQVEAPVSGLFTFSVRTDDGVRLWVNNQLLIDKWYPQFGNVWPGSIQLTAGQRYDIRMEMFEWTGGAEAHLWWQYPSLPQQQIVPASRLYPYATAQPLYEGKIESGNNCTAVSGWALDRRQPNTSINVGIYVDGSTTPTATVTANQSRPDLIVCSGENGLHGFSWTVPASLKNGSQHTIQVKYGGTAINLGIPVSFTCVGGSVPPPLAIAPTVTAGSSVITVQWSYTGTTQAGFVIQRRDGSTGAFADYKTINSASARSDTDTLVVSGHTYCYKVIPFNGAGRASDPNLFGCATIQGAASGPPAAPNGLNATFMDSPRGVNLTWSDNSNNETSFKVWRRSRKTNNPTGWSGYGSAPIATRSANTVSYFDSSTLVLGMTYGYVVQASNSSGNSAYSNEAQVSVTSTPSSPCVGVNSLSGSGSYGYVDAAGSAAQWAGPSASATGVDPVSGLSALFIADTENNLIRLVYLDGPAAGSSVLIAGTGLAGYFDSDDGYQAWFNRPQGIAAIKNESGVVQSLLVADTDNNIIRQLLPPLGDGHWRTTFFAGNMDPGSTTIEGQLTFNSPHGIAIGLDGMIYVADTGNCEICMLNQAGYGVVWYQDPDVGFALGTGQMVGFQPVSLAINEVTGQIYATDEFYDEIDEMTTGSRVTLAGSHSAGYADGVGTAAAFDLPQSLTWADSDTGSNLYIADANNNRLRVLDLGTNTVTTWAGSGTAGNVNAICTAAQFNSPTGLALGTTGQVYVVDLINNSIRSVQ